ncbi:MAG: hypothetical protein HY752_01560 [Nitrospirae bacterium]|nr:hypothetical protein [Nitrospirota bacterium]
MYKKFFPEAHIKSTEKRGIIFEARVDISENVFLEIYYNSLTGKKSYSLISDNNRIFGYDNYKYWHLHPADNPSNHIPCKEPLMEEVFLNMKNLISSK